MTDDAPAVRAAARTVLAQLEAADAVALLDQALASGERIERQAALAALANLRGTAVNDVLAKSLDRLLAGEFPADSQLDLLAAAEPQLNRHAQGQSSTEYEAAPQVRTIRSPPWRACLEGGDAERGRKLFFERGQLSCVRCHKIGGTGGDVGPDLTKIADRQAARVPARIDRGSRARRSPRILSRS